MRHDLPRSGGGQEPLSPPTYVMKMLFLAGVCHELHPTGEFRDFAEVTIEDWFKRFSAPERN